MRIGIIGASGNIGSRIHTEATARGHEVAAFTRSGAAAKGAGWRELDVFDLDALSAVVGSVDVVVSAFHPGNSARDIGDALQRAIADPTAYARVAANLVKALERRTATRAIVVGGAANLEIAPGVTTSSAPAERTFADRSTRRRRPRGRLGRHRALVGCGHVFGLIVRFT